jgi:hypothetical protein
VSLVELRQSALANQTSRVGSLTYIMLIWWKPEKCHEEKKVFNANVRK